MDRSGGTKDGAHDTAQALASLGVALPVLAAPAAERSAGPSLQVSKPVTITAWFPVTGNYAPYLQAQTDLFQQANDKVKVTLEPSGTTDKLQAAIVGGEPPDIQQSNYIPMFIWAQQGALEPIDPYLDQRGKADFHDWAREGSTIDGKMYEWPWMLNPTGPVINSSLFARRTPPTCCPSRA